jgi:hypothetical protein
VLLQPHAVYHLDLQVKKERPSFFHCLFVHIILSIPDRPKKKSSFIYLKNQLDKISLALIEIIFESFCTLIISYLPGKDTMS